MTHMLHSEAPSMSLSLRHEKVDGAQRVIRRNVRCNRNPSCSYSPLQPFCFFSSLCLFPLFPPPVFLRRRQTVGAGNTVICRKPPVWASEVPMTLGQLLSKCDEFWDTAPAFAGRPEIWQALRAAAECGDEATAQAITSAVNIT